MAISTLLKQALNAARAQHGIAAEQRACHHLEQQGLRRVAQNYRCKGGEIDLIMQANDGTVVFVEVRSRSSAEFGGALASITPAKQRKILLAAQHYLQQFRQLPPCRFDVVAFEGEALTWIPDAFGA